MLRVLLVGSATYLALVVLLRLSRKRTLAKMNAFDLVAAVALGSTLATILLSKTVALAEGLLALGLLIAWQYFLAWSLRQGRLGAALDYVRSEAAVFTAGEFLNDALRKERVTEGEIRAARELDLFR